MKTRSILALLLCTSAAVPLIAADETRQYFVYREDTGGTPVITIQQPASPTRTVTFEGALFTTGAACTITLEINGTAATGTALTVRKLNTKAPAATATGWYASDAGTGTVIHKYELTAVGTYPINKAGLALGPVAAQNFTFRTNCGTSLKSTIFWSE